MKNKEFLKRLYTAAKLQKKLERVQKSIAEEFADCCEWDIEDIIYGCCEKDEKLYDTNGDLLASETCSGDISEKYYVNQCTGYCEDDFYGTLYYVVDRNGTVVEISYHC